MNGGDGFLGKLVTEKSLTTESGNQFCVILGHQSLPFNKCMLASAILLWLALRV